MTPDASRTLIDALLFYADPNNWLEDDSDFPLEQVEPSEVFCDQGERAREALDKIGILAPSERKCPHTWSDDESSESYCKKCGLGFEARLLGRG